MRLIAALPAFSLLVTLILTFVTLFAGNGKGPLGDASMGEFDTSMLMKNLMANSTFFFLDNRNPIVNFTSNVHIDQAASHPIMPMPAPGPDVDPLEKIMAGMSQVLPPGVPQAIQAFIQTIVGSIMDGTGDAFQTFGQNVTVAVGPELRPYAEEFQQASQVLQQGFRRQFPLLLPNITVAVSRSLQAGIESFVKNFTSQGHATRDVAMIEGGVNLQSRAENELYYASLLDKRQAPPVQGAPPAAPPQAPPSGAAPSGAPSAPPMPSQAAPPNGAPQPPAIQQGGSQQQSEGSIEQLLGPLIQAIMNGTKEGIGRELATLMSPQSPSNPSPALDEMKAQTLLNLRFAVNNMMNTGVDTMKTMLGFYDFYTANLLNFCYGYYDPSPAFGPQPDPTAIPAPTPTKVVRARKTQGCSTLDRVGSYDLSIPMTRAMAMGGIVVDIPHIPMPDMVVSNLFVMRTLTNFQFAAYILAIIFTVFALGGSVAAIFITKHKTLVTGTVLCTIFVQTWLLMGSAMTTIVLLDMAPMVDSMKPFMNLKFTYNTTYIGLTWAATAFSMIAAGVWITVKMGDTKKEKKERLLVEDARRLVDGSPTLGRGDTNTLGRVETNMSNKAWQ
ncbi:hypothetical protein K402DRAFT_402406 [Aulographum hederae CBS 113979]|uniref:Uncharacterized protein n=1 Tax=Aulographum hederae CBS 113979 TaxID=1176131 RepID=A0A6G1H6T9_9PEZI|nr:hypothetical protein K402DRAFT_402406 [Aulographum hederae CBS 113979]